METGAFLAFPAALSILKRALLTWKSTLVTWKTALLEQRSSPSSRKAQVSHSSALSVRTVVLFGSEVALRRKKAVGRR